ncbi:MAG: hypothetical protein AB7L76_22455, partial [Burkholderiaceae bacterium]
MTRQRPPAAMHSPAPRGGDELMSPERACAAVPTALNFARALFREMARGRWRLHKLRVDLDADGRGEVLYRLASGARDFHFFVVSNSIPAELKIDRNFGTHWDAMAVLCQGEWTPQREAHLRREIPKARAGHTDYDTLMYARGNRSGRLFDQVVEQLAQGRQPDAAALAGIGYILRTTAFIGNGAIGTRPLRGYEADHPLRRPYHAQMCAAFLLREYVYDLVDRMANARSATAVPLAQAYRRYLGLGNSAATGLVPFVVHRPKVVAHWCRVQENALLAARRRPVQAGDERIERFRRLLAKAIRYHDESERPDDGIFVPPSRIAAELRALEQAFDGLVAAVQAGVLTHADAAPVPLWEALHQHALDAGICPATIEVLLGLFLELYPDIIDAASADFLADETMAVDPSMSVGELGRIVAERYGWTERFDLADPDERHYFWYRSSAAPLDMRRGVRGLLPRCEAEMGTDMVLRIDELRRALAVLPPTAPVTELLVREPQLRYVVMRVQSLRDDDYAELRTNYLS